MSTNYARDLISQATTPARYSSPFIHIALGGAVLFAGGYVIRYLAKYTGADTDPTLSRWVTWIGALIVTIGLAGIALTLFIRHTRQRSANHTLAALPQKDRDELLLLHIAKEENDIASHNQQNNEDRHGQL